MSSLNIQIVSTMFFTWQKFAWVNSHHSGNVMLQTATLLSNIVRRHLDRHGGEAGFLHAEQLRRLLGKVDDAARDIGTAIGDRHLDRAAILQIRHPRLGAERQAAMRGGEASLIEALAAGGEPAIEARPVPGGRADLAIGILVMRVMAMDARRGFRSADKWKI